jgi:bifunctional UDP-N-acetylglucosamine pyrophosphorylase / glucosamine-1-phosphate N-acetyltransferase
VRDGAEVLRIVEEKTTPRKRKTIREINTGIYVFAAPFVFEALQGVGRDNAQRRILSHRRRGRRPRCGKKVLRPLVSRSGRDHGDQRSRAACRGRRPHARTHQPEEHMRRSEPGRSKPPTSMPMWRSAADTLIHPGVHLRGGTRLGRGCEIEPGVIVTDCTWRRRPPQGRIGPSESRIGAACTIGPMAHLRPGTILAKGTTSWATSSRPKGGSRTKKPRPAT